MDAQAPPSKRRVPTGFWVVLVFTLAVCAWFLNTYSTPEGMWNEPRLGNEGFAYYEVSDGKFEFNIEETGRTLLGTCERRGGKWMVTPTSGRPFNLTASPWTLRMVDSDEVPIGPSCRRLFFRPHESLPTKVKLTK